MFELKPLHPDAVAGRARPGRALSPAERAERSREHLPRRAGGGARTTRPARITLLLALTDQFDEAAGAHKAARDAARRPDLGLRPRLLRRHHRRAAGQGAVRARRRGGQRRRLRLADRGDAALRARRSPPPARATTTRGCAGTRACGSSSVIRSCGRRSTTAARSRCWSRVATARTGRPRPLAALDR